MFLKNSNDAIQHYADDITERHGAGRHGNADYVITHDFSAAYLRPCWTPTVWRHDLVNVYTCTPTHTHLVFE